VSSDVIIERPRQAGAWLIPDLAEATPQLMLIRWSAPISARYVALWCYLDRTSAPDIHLVDLDSGVHEEAALERPEQLRRALRWLEDPRRYPIDLDSEKG
jgi:hypothetical protein